MDSDLQGAKGGDGGRMSNDLKPCPFCGGNPVKKVQYGVVAARDVVAYHCENRANKCPVNMRTRYCETEEEAAELWNTRNDRAVIDGFLARVYVRSHASEMDWPMKYVIEEVYAEMFGKEQSDASEQSETGENYES